MQLIDELEKRSDSVQIVELVEHAEMACDESGGWWLTLNGYRYGITTEAFETLLNLLRIPIKYVYRCVEFGSIPLAESTVNFWLALQDLSYLIEHQELPVVTQVYPGKRLYIPSVKINDLILEYLQFDAHIQSYEVDGDIFNALYITEQSEEIAGSKYRLGVRVLYSDCFTITPRFDGVVYSFDNNALFGWPTIGRKFRVASTTIPQVIDQIQDFLDLSIDGLKQTLIPALNGTSGYKIDKLIEAESFVIRLCSDLRLSKRIQRELMEHCVQYLNHMPIELLVNIAAYTNGSREDSEITMAVARDIQIALSTYAVKGSFK